jgi:capsular polysaccharide biosynthesis protein
MELLAQRNSDLPSREEVKTLEIIIGFVVSVAAGIVSYYICKWLDRHVKGQ